MTIEVLHTPLTTAALMIAEARTRETPRAAEIDAVLAEPTPEPNPVGAARTMRDIVRDMIATA